MCRACITVNRKCPNAQVEIDLETGMTWGDHRRISVIESMSDPQVIFPDHKCSRKLILSIFTMNLETLTIDLVYGDNEPAYTHFTVWCKSLLSIKLLFHVFTLLSLRFKMD